MTVPREVLVTGGAGFIGSHLVDRLLERNDRVTVVDNFDDFYDAQIKEANLARHKNNAALKLVRADIRNKEDMQRIFNESRFDVVVHLAAKAGVRPSLKNPHMYMDVNALGTQNLLDYCTSSVRKPLFVFASSSSVYGERASEAFLETDRTDRPMSPYAASKVAAEAACYAAHKTSGLQVACLRFFTVYGPRQRPDLAIHKFCKLIDAGQPIEMFGDGTSLRDYTYVADTVFGLERALALREPGYEIINLGRSSPVVLADLIACIEKSLKKKATIINRPVQPGDVPNTFANIDKARLLLGYEPSTSIEEGIDQFVKWYLLQARALNSATAR